MPKPRKRKLPTVPKAKPAASTTTDLPAAPPRLESVRAPRTKPSIALVVLLASAIVSVAFGGFGAWHGFNGWRDSSIVESRVAAADAATSAVETIYTYRYNKLDEHDRAAQAAMTPKFAKTIPPTTKVLKKLAPARRTQVKAVARYAATKECGDSCSPDKATVLVFFDMATANADSEKPTVVSPRLDVVMVKRDGKWLVDNIKWL